MAVKSIIDIDINDVKFTAFKRQFDAFDAARKKLPGGFAALNGQMANSEEHFKSMVQMTASIAAAIKAAEKGQQGVSQNSRNAGKAWSDMARDTREVARNITSATTSLLKWASITGLISGLIGAGGLFGVDRLALGVATGRRSALGLGLGYGEQAAIGTNLGRFIDPDSFLASVAGAKFDISKRVGLIGAGLTESQIGGSTGQTAVALLRRLKQIADTTNPQLYAQTLQARRLEQFASPTDLNRLRNTTREEFETVLTQLAQREKQFDLAPDVQRKWQDLTTQLDNAGKAINTVLVNGLVNLAPGLLKLSESVSKIAGTLFEKGGPLEKWVVKLNEAMEKFAGYIGTDEFQQKVEAFVNGLGAIADAIAKAVMYVGGGDPDLAKQREDNASRVQSLRDERASGKATAAQQLGRIFGFGGEGSGSEITFDQLVNKVRRLEGSGDAEVSTAGAIGRYQIMPGTAVQYGGDPSRLTDPVYNEQLARKILTDLTRRYHGNVSEILAAYNAGPGRANQYRNAGDNPSVLPRETQKYISGTSGMKVTIDNKAGADVNVSTNALKD